MNTTSLSFDDEVRQKTFTCSKCGLLNEPIILEHPLRPGKKVVIMRTCQCEIERMERERIELQEAEKKHRIKRLFDTSMLCPRFAECTFENWMPMPGTEVAHYEAQNFISSFSDKMRTGEGLLFYGPPGNGKSHLAAAIANKLISMEFTVVFANVPSLLGRIRKTYSEKRGETEVDILQAVSDCSLLILDDAGAEKWSDWVETTLYTIVDDRYRHKKPMIITTNLTLKALEDAIGFRAFDRILEMCMVVENSGESFRRRKAKERITKLQKSSSCGKLRA